MHLELREGESKKRRRKWIPARSRGAKRGCICGASCRSAAHNVHRKPQEGGSASRPRPSSANNIRNIRIIHPTSDADLVASRTWEGTSLGASSVASAIICAPYLDGSKSCKKGMPLPSDWFRCAREGGRERRRIHFRLLNHRPHSLFRPKSANKMFVLPNQSVLRPRGAQDTRSGEREERIEQMRFSCRSKSL